MAGSVALGVRTQAGLIVDAQDLDVTQTMALVADGFGRHTGQSAKYELT